MSQDTDASRIAVPTEGKPHLPYIDCVRGYAILMVLTCHLAYVFPLLPYPVHRVAVTGWFGVQLFFLASCLTLLRSWASERQRTGWNSIGAFFLRRILRIAPAYYLTAVFYGVLHPPAAGRDPWEIAASLTFVNALTPHWALEPRSLVPGGWSIGCEFAFYAVFPVFARYVTSLRRAWLAFAAAILFGWVANRLAWAWFAGPVSPETMAIGLFRWFPNECSVFALGAVAYFLIADEAAAWQRWMRGRATWVALAAVAVFVGLAYLPMGGYIGDTPPWPATLCVGAVFTVAVVALSTGPGVLVNRWVARVGTVSFSAYLLHFAVLDLIRAVPDLAHVQASGLAAITAFAACWPVAVLGTLSLSWVSYRLIEVPMIKWGKSIIRAQRAIPVIS